MTTLIALTIAFVITSSITTFDKRLTQAKRSGILPPDEPLLPSWVAFIYWIHIGLIIAMLIINWKYALIVLVIGFILEVLPVWETIGNILMSPFKPKQAKSKLKPLWGEPLAELIRQITGRNLPTFALMGIPEATVISVVDGYYCYKSQLPYLSENEIFERIIKARGYNSKSEKEQRIMNKEFRNLINFIENVLETEGQANKLSRENIENLISRYKQLRLR